MPAALTTVAPSAMSAAVKAPGFFDGVTLAPSDPILGVNEAYLADEFPGKISLGVGAYRTEKGLPYVLPVVKRVEQQIWEDPRANHEYLPIDGLPVFQRLATELIFGPDCAAISDGRIVTVQTLSGSGALRIGLTFVARYYADASSLPPIYIPSPTWNNHRDIVPDAGLGEARTFRYLDAKSGGVDMPGLLADLSDAPVGAIVILHGCAHNPTGADPTLAEWRDIVSLVRERRLIPFFDVAYQGFASGDLDTDAGSVRLFADAGVDMLLSLSFAKNMGLYGERIGSLSVVLSEHTVNVPATAKAVRSQLKAVIRPMYSSPPAHGARIVAGVLGDATNFAAWKEELAGMASRIGDMRTALKAALDANGAPGDWTRIVKQQGMFSYTGLSAAHVAYLRSKYHIYMTSDGRVSMAGLTTSTVQRVADAIKDAVETVV
ncbi:hypothetical protein BU14_0519s0012 [Porphyra umbilicalis]|uniref:Aspartate aminotransferase n=1 Tax=Porphyra umbilicalis TaxID=2786 RepID=A0A1X6NSP7_PORUM|nr:hypothetical protein BU14_0519s0012 [Porphyra umbilicalis]|eukprot:OSX71597.1 hypothetical protein BU14_0519s0012 [Porphyra umbilicalis]